MNRNLPNYIESEMKNLIALLSNELDPTDAVIVIQFLLCLKRINSLPKIDETKGYFESILTALENSNNSYSNSLIRVKFDLADSFGRVTNKSYRIISEEILSLNDNEVVKLFYLLVEELKKNNKLGLFESSIISELIVSIAKIKNGSKILIPYPRTGEIISRLENTHVTIKSDKHVISNSIRVFRSIIEVIDSQKQLSLYETSGINAKYDLILSEPPIDRRLYDTGKGYGYRKLEADVIDSGLDEISDNGQIVISCSQSFGFSLRKEEKQLRDRLIEDNLLDEVIELPGGILKHSGIHLLVLKIRKGRKENESIKMVDATSFYNKGERKFELQNFLIDYHKNSDIIKEVSINDIKDKNNILLPKRYIVHAPGVKLLEILSQVKRQMVKDESNPLVFSYKDFPEFPLSPIVNFEKVSLSVNRKNFYEVLTPCLLVSRITNKLRICYYESIYELEVLKIDNHIMAFSITQDNIDIEGLVTQMYTTTFRKQIEAYQTGTAQQIIRRDDFLELRVDIDSLYESKQSKLIDGKISNYKENVEAYIKDKDEQYHVDIASLNHSLGTARQNILSSSNIINQYLKQNQDDPVVINFLEKFQALNNYEFSELTKSIKSDIGFISRTLKYGFEGLKLENYNKESILVSSLPDIVRELYRPHYNFILDVWDELDKKELSTLYINTDLFRAMITNLFENAHKHGFKQKLESNKVVVEIEELDDLCNISISNNGLPFPESFTQNQFVAKYSSTVPNSTGMGGYDVKRIVDYFDGDFSLITNQFARLNVEFFIQIPIEIDGHNEV